MAHVLVLNYIDLGRVGTMQELAKMIVNEIVSKQGPNVQPKPKINLIE